jgi:hypothetical protein
MMAKYLRPGINEIFLLSRSLRFVASESWDTELIVTKIDDMPGINTVSLDNDQLMLHLSYDASQLSIDEIEEVIEKCGIRISRDWWTRIKKNWYQFTDSNSRSNASHRSGCCK